MEKNNYSKNLKEIRKASGLTQQALAKITNVPPGNIAYYELGGGVRIDIYHKLIDACKKQIAKNAKKYLTHM